MQNFRSHEVSYFRIPSIGPNEEFAKLASLGLKFQWPNPSSSSGQWQEAVAQRVTMTSCKKPTSLKTGMMILAMLTRSIYVNGPTGASA